MGTQNETLRNSKTSAEIGAAPVMRILYLPPKIALVFAKAASNCSWVVLPV